jgi:glycosyltransferase involved in cell wall biosynthesis
MEPDVSVVIATRDRAARLQAALASLRAQTLSADRFEVVVVDDGSRDGTPAALAVEVERGELALHVLRRQDSRGSGAARNEGWRTASAPVVAFLDDDCEADPDWLEKGLRTWGGDTSRIVQGATSPIAEELDRMGPFSYTVDIPEMSDAFETCNIFYPRGLLEQLDGFDTAAFPGAQGEDADLAWRAKDLGAQPVFEPNARVRHAVVVLGPAGFLRRVWSWHRAMPLYKRHPELRRRRMVYRVFWSPSHVLVLRTWLALLLPWRWWLLPAKFWLARWYLDYRLPHPRTQRASLATLAWFFVADSVEVAAALRGSLPNRTLVL